MRIKKRKQGQGSRYAAACDSLAGLGSALRIRGRQLGPRSARDRDSRSDRRIADLTTNLELSGIDIPPETVMVASNMLAALSLFPLLVALFLACFLIGPKAALPLSFFAVLGPLLIRELFLAHPASLARNKAARVLKDSPDSVNLMIMGLRHEPSISKALSFASQRENAFSHELRRTTWGVVMGAYTSFEDALYALGARWSRYSDELSDSLNAMVIASCESTEDGRRRALDRANLAMVAGTKRRIEDYALSLSTPSMIMFSLGILLPLMVGSFLPMLSWNLWSLDNPREGVSPSGDQSVVEMAFLMNVLFPAIAAIVALSAISRHPLNVRGEGGDRRWTGNLTGLGVALICSVASVVFVAVMLKEEGRGPAILLAAVCPVSLWLIMDGRDASSPNKGVADLEDALFRTGSRMIDGENFEVSLNRAGQICESESSEMLRRLSFRTNAVGQDFDLAARDEGRGRRSRNLVEGLRVVRDAARKDEQSAGRLAMDLATYLRDLRELETTLKIRLRPTISMMKMTIYALAPIVLGVTYAIYLTLSSMVEGGSAHGVFAPSFFLVLGVFLAETNVVVSFFIWGIDGSGERKELKRSLGSCLLMSQLIYVATATIAS